MDPLNRTTGQTRTCPNLSASTDHRGVDRTDKDTPPIRGCPLSGPLSGCARFDLIEAILFELLRGFIPDEAVPFAAHRLAARSPSHSHVEIIAAIRGRTEPAVGR
jgi:hypothetical protein